jgi:tetratricopeptide (TPR) repeat protein
MRVTIATTALALLVAGPPAFAQTPPSSGAAIVPSAQAYYEFMLARRLESDGDLEGALAALERAEKLDPASAELLAERAALHARQNQGPQARDAAERALALDTSNVEAHRILALVYSAWSEGAGQRPAGETVDGARRKAVEHFRAIRATPAMATDLSLQIAFGRQLLRSGDGDEAITILEAVASQAPYLAEPYVLLAEARTAKGQMMEAAEALAQAAEINPRYYVSLADLYEKLGRWAAAAGAYGQAIEGMRQPSRDLRLRHVTALLNVPGGAGASRAKDTLTELLETNPDDVRLLYMLSTASRQLDDSKGAEDAARRILAIDPTSLTGLNALSRTLMDQYQYRQVVDVVTPLAKDVAARTKGRESEGASVLAQMGLAHQQLGEYDAAVTAFTTAKGLVPDEVAFDLYLAQALLAARRNDRALALTTDALVRHPDETRLVRLRAQALSRLGRSGEAITFLETAIKTESRSPELAFALAETYASQKRFDEAVKVIEQAETAFGESDEFTLRLTTFYEQAGRVADAERELRRLIERDPLDSTALNYLGYMLADRTDRHAEAIELIERALKVEPGNPAYLDSLGWALFKQGKVEAALAPLSKAAAAVPANSVIQDHFGDALARQGKWSEAVAAWQRALTGDGESIDTATVEKKIRDGRRRR